MIADYINKKESEKLEFKSEFNDTVKEKLFKTICAFANDFKNDKKVGIFIIGFNDSGKLSNYNNSKQDEAKIINWINNWVVNPKPTVEIEAYKEDNNEIIEIKVHPSNLPTWYNKEMYIREGSSTRKAKNYEINKVLANFKNISFDSSDCINANIDDIDEELFIFYQKYLVSQDIINGNNRNLIEKLASSSFANINSNKPTYAGLLVCGKNPQRHLPMAHILFLSIDSDDLLDRSQIKNEKILEGDLSKIIRELESLIEINIKQTLDSVSGSMKKKFDYPFNSIRELAFNALMHRDYSISNMIKIYWFKNKIEITSPGGLKEGLSKERFPYQSGYRNPTISSAMKNLGKVERFGSGIQVAQNDLANNGNPDIVFDIEEYEIKVTIFK